jgi:hypothetical protein
VERLLIGRLGSLGDTVAALHVVERALPWSEQRLLTKR